MQIIHSPTKDEPFIVLNKTAGVASAPLSPSDKNNAVSIMARQFPEILNINAKKQIEGGLIHRLDTQTSGLLLIATTQEFYDFMQNEQKNGKFIKIYEATCEINEKNGDLLQGFPPLTNEMQDFFALKKGDFAVQSFFRNYGKNNKEVRPVTDESNTAALKKIQAKKLYETKVQIVSEKNNILHVKCTITKGYRHQVRCHLAWLGFPVMFDGLYNANFKNSCENSENRLQFFATGLKFSKYNFFLTPLQ